MKESKSSSSSVIIIGCALTLLNILFLAFWHFNKNNEIKPTQLLEHTIMERDFLEEILTNKNTNLPKEHLDSVKTEFHPPKELPINIIEVDEPEELCVDPLWCNVEMPSVSHYNFFPPPTDRKRWRRAQIQASNGEQVLLREVIKHFPSQFDFLNGDRSFKPLQPLVDVFINDKTWFNDITSKPSPLHEQAITEDIKDIVPSQSSGAGEKGKSREITDLAVLLKSVPNAWDFRKNDRAPIIQLGFPVFKKDDNTFFSGKSIGGVYLSQPKIFENWNLAKNNINTPFIALSVLNENWGFLSTVFPRRVANWSICRCEKIPRVGQLFREFLNHDKTVMLMVSQHHNQSHPKILTLPRGLPLEWEATDKLVWDAQRYSLTHVKRTVLLFASASSWGPSECVHVDLWLCLFIALVAYIYVCGLAMCVYVYIYHYPGV